MIDALILHGSFGSPFGNWFPWLYEELTKIDKKIIVPHFPTHQDQNLDNWSKVLDSYAHLIGPDTTVYAHSLAPAFVVDFFVARKIVISKAVLVAPFYGLIGINDFDEVNKTFFVDESLINKFADICGERICIFSDNDPYVPIDLSKSFAEKMAADINVIVGGKHLNAEAGYSKFPELLSL